jgi:hypothetical protein
MLSQCANPNCSRAFHYLSEGKLFQLELASGSPVHAGESGQRKRPRRLEFFWLCNDCAAQMTLISAPGSGVTVAPLAKVHRAAAS